jgi:3-isopropylmalate dehydrogenase (EC 1.1.1.85)
MSKTYKIAVIPGDGTGPEVVRESVKVLKAAAQAEGFKLDLAEYDFAASATSAREKLSRTAPSKS